jgi:F0F1-type ATP synthase membrane subunit a
MLGSLLFVPFTEQYARESVPPEYWHSPLFRVINRHISAAFAVAILVMAASHFYSGYRESQHDLSQRLNLLLNWAVPIVVILAAIRYTSRITSDSAQPSRSGSGSTSA